MNSNEYWPADMTKIHLKAFNKSGSLINGHQSGIAAASLISDFSNF